MRRIRCYSGSIADCIDSHSHFDHSGKHARTPPVMEFPKFECYARRHVIVPCKDEADCRKGHG